MSGCKRHFFMGSLRSRWLLQVQVGSPVLLYGILKLFMDFRQEIVVDSTREKSTLVGVWGILHFKLNPTFSVGSPNISNPQKTL